MYKRLDELNKSDAENRKMIVMNRSNQIQNNMENRVATNKLASAQANAEKQKNKVYEKFMASKNKK